MLQKIKIPSIFLKIISGFYKGYDAEYRGSTHGGEFLHILINASGILITVHIINVAFILSNGELLRYIPNNNGGFNLVGEEITNYSSPEFLDLDEMNRLNDMIIEEDIKNMIEEEDIKNNKRRLSYQEEENNDLVAYNHFEHIARNSVTLINTPISYFLKELYELLRFDMDNTSINYHTNILQNAINNSPFKSVVFNTDLYKTFVMAYIFIYINNMNIGYPEIADCFPRPNDDPSFIICYSIKTNFISPDIENLNITNQIDALLLAMHTRIIPSQGITNLVNRFNNVRISKKQKTEPIIKRTPKPLRFPIYDTNQIEIKVKKNIIDKVKNKLKKIPEASTRKLLKNFISNFDNYIKGPMFTKLNYNPTLQESKILIPFIKEYKERLDFEEDKLYQKKYIKNTENGSDSGNGSAYPIRSGQIQQQHDKTYENEVKQLVINDINSKINEKIKDKKLSAIEKNALNLVLKNHMDIILYPSNYLKSLRLSLNTAEGQKKENILSMLMYNKMYTVLFNKLMLKKEKQDMESIKNQIIITSKLRKMDL